MMFSKNLMSVVVAVVLAFSSTSSWAQGRNQSDAGQAGPGKHLKTIVFAGLAGAVLGLSTLSFYGRPQEKLSNIAVGAAFGIITGTVFSTYKAATEPREFYNLNYEPELWRVAEQSSRFSQTLELTPQASWKFTF